MLPEQIGMSQATLSSYKKRNKLEQDMLDKIAKALNIPLETLTELGDDAVINIVARTLIANDDAAIFNYYPSFNPMIRL